MPQQAATRIPDREYEKIQDLVEAGLYLNVSDFVRDAIRSRLAELALGSRRVDPEGLQGEVEAHLRERGGEVWPDEVAEALDVSILDVLEALEALAARGRAEEVRRLEREA